MLPLLLSIGVAACSGSPKLDPEQSAILQSAERSGATSLSAARTDDGGMRLNGYLGGRQFAVVIPWRWNKEVVLFAHGYTLPGSSLAVPENPLADDPTGVMRTPYAQGFAVGHSAYDKAGVGVQTGVESTHGLKVLMDKLGAKRTYLFGSSMGGDIVVASIEKYPGDYAGAVAACGAVSGWLGPVAWMQDIRATYNYFTHGTPYELPGEKSITRQALSTLDTKALGSAGTLVAIFQAKRLAAPVLRLFAAARKNPGGPEDRMLDNIAAVSGAAKDPAALIYPMAIMALGKSDMDAVFGGEIYDNTAKVYSSPHLTAAENAALNRGIERVHSDPAAVARAKAWYTPTGRFTTKLMTLYAAVDAISPGDANEKELRRAVEQAGNGDNLVQRKVPPLYGPMMGIGGRGLSHCGFTADQVSAVFHDLRAWVENGKHP